MEIQTNDLTITATILSINDGTQFWTIFIPPPHCHVCSTKALVLSSQNPLPPPPIREWSFSFLDGFIKCFNWFFVTASNLTMSFWQIFPLSFLGLFLFLLWGNSAAAKAVETHLWIFESGRHLYQSSLTFPGEKKMFFKNKCHL